MRSDVEEHKPVPSSVMTPSSHMGCASMVRALKTGRVRPAPTSRGGALFYYSGTLVGMVR
jgi:hypothetical protein